MFLSYLLECIRLRGAYLSKIVCLALIPFYATGCVIIPGNTHYTGPQSRPPEIAEYYGYNKQTPYFGLTEEVVGRKDRYTKKQIVADTDHGQMVIDYYQRPEPSDQLIFIFPILGGRPILEGYFARYFALHGFDTAIVNRDKDFKDPKQFDHIEEIFRNNVIRDRIAMDIFEQKYGKKRFASFGISRGGINAATTAGVDPRLEYNVIVLGGSHLVELFKKTDVGGVQRYRERVMEAQGITTEEFFQKLEETIRTDPKNLAHYIDASKTLMVLGVFDQSVPFRYGMKLRREIGLPRTVFLFSGHITGVLFTQFLQLFPPSETFCIFPFDFIESEALNFYNRSFDTKRYSLGYVPFQLLQIPFEILGQLYFFANSPD